MGGSLNSHAIHLALAHFIDSLRHRELIRRGRVSFPDHDGSIKLSVELAPEGDRHYRLTTDELRMGGPDAFYCWAAQVEGDIKQLSTAAQDRVAHRRREITATQIMMQQAAMQERMRQWEDIGVWFQLQQYGGYGGAAGSGEAPEARAKREEADKKAKDLFIMVAGKPAFDTLESGKPLPITGSKGTAYTLHKRASYCVERVKDKARLCAVVPNVPLWDHLLGIKLMVEQDEDKFLKTANVSGGDVVAFDEFRTLAHYAMQVQANHRIIGWGTAV